MNTLGKYQLVRKLATGGMAEVFLARADGPMGFQKTLVVKRVLPHFAENPLFTAMFLTEAKLAARLDHPNVVQVFDFGEVSGSFYLAMEYIDGPNLRTLIHQAWRRGEPPSYALSAKIASLACEGLAYAHAFRDPETSESLNLVHRDVSPENIIISRSGAVKVVDFGIAKVSTGVNLTKSGVIKGKMAYMPPEQLARGPLDQRVDVFALGMVLHEMLCGTMPFDSTSEVTIIQAIMGPDPIPSIADQRPEVPEPLQRIVSTALSKQRDTRYRDCRTFQKDLDRFLASTGESVPGHAIADWVRAMEMPIEVRENNVPSADEIAKHLAATDSGVADTAVRRSPPPTGDGATLAQGKRRAPETIDEFARFRPVPIVPDTIPGRPTPVGEELPTFRRSRRGLVIGATALVLAGAGAVLAWQRLPETTGTLVATDSAAPGVAIAAPTGVAAPPVGSAPPSSAVPPIAEVVPEPTAQPVEGRPGEIIPAVAAKPSGTDATAASVAAAGPESAPPSATARPDARTQVEFRVRPYAFIYVDGRALGQTPFAPVRLSPGAHRIQLVNEALSKDVNLRINVPQQREYVFRYNLAD